MIGIIGSGTMGSGIAQIASTNGHKVVLFDSSSEALKNSQEKLEKILDRLVEKEKITSQESQEILARICFSTNLKDIKDSEIVIEAIIEDLEVK